MGRPQNKALERRVGGIHAGHQASARHCHLVIRLDQLSPGRQRYISDP